MEKDSIKQGQINSEIQINKSLTWKQQINHVEGKISKINTMLRKSRYVLVKNVSVNWAQDTKLVKGFYLLRKNVSG